MTGILNMTVAHQYYNQIRSHFQPWTTTKWSREPVLCTNSLWVGVVGHILISMVSADRSPSCIIFDPAPSPLHFLYIVSWCVAFTLFCLHYNGNIYACIPNELRHVDNYFSRWCPALQVLVAIDAEVYSACLHMNKLDIWKYRPGGLEYRCGVYASYII